MKPSPFNVPAAANLGESAQSGSLGPQLPAEDGPQVQRSWQLPQWFLGRLWDKRGRGNVHLILREILDFVPQSQEQGKLQLGRGKVEVHIRLCVMQTLIASVRRSHTTLAVNPVLCCVRRCRQQCCLTGLSWFPFGMTQMGRTTRRNSRGSLRLAV